MDGLPGGLASVVQLHTLSIDLAHHVIAESDGPSSLSKATLPAFAAVRRQASTLSSDALRDSSPALPPPPPELETKRRARQAALRRARAAREDVFGPQVAPVMSITDLSSGSDADCTTQSSASSGTDGLAGPLRKRGRKTRMLMKRHFVLVGSTLYNYRWKRDIKPSWKLNLEGANVGTDATQCRIVIFLDGHRQLVLYARTAKELEVWGSALARAADSASEFCRNDSPTCVTQQRFDRESDDFDTEQSKPVKEIDVVDMARMAKESGEWDSFRSFSALQVRTTWKRQEPSS